MKRRFTEKEAEAIGGAVYFFDFEEEDRTPKVLLPREAVTILDLKDMVDQVLLEELVAEGKAIAKALGCAQE